MREIEFRGKRKDNTVHSGSWVYGHYLVAPLTDENSGMPPETGWFFLSPSEPLHCIESDGVVFVVDNNTVSQYTGASIDEDTKIYEGDVLECKFYHAARPWWKNLEHKKEVDAQFEEQRRQVENVRGVVRFVEGAFNIQLSHHTLPLSVVHYDKTEKWSAGGADFESRWWDFKKIGNIYDNPELLEVSYG